jgi:hypothetical protein
MNLHFFTENYNLQGKMFYINCVFCGALGG